MSKQYSLYLLILMYVNFILRIKTILKNIKKTKNKEPAMQSEGAKPDCNKVLVLFEKVKVQCAWNRTDEKRME